MFKFLCELAINILCHNFCLVFIYLSLAWKQVTQKIERLRCNNGGEYILNNIKEFCNENEINMQYMHHINP